jgi:NAD(P)-dependent dehydrogenase (short-subunit alcohol dehydrogenase family)
VNSAGHGPKGKILEISDEDWHLAMDVYLLNVVRIARLVTPILQARGGGAIVNISTFATFEPDPAFPTSGTLRASLASFTKLFSDEYAGSRHRDGDFRGLFGPKVDFQATKSDNLGEPSRLTMDAKHDE